MNVRILKSIEIFKNTYFLFDRMPDCNLKVKELIKLSPTAKAVRFELNGQSFPFIPGQFIMLQIDLEKSGKFKVNGDKNKIQKRAFSMSSSPTEKGHLEVLIWARANGCDSRPDPNPDPCRRWRRD